MRSWAARTGDFRRRIADRHAACGRVGERITDAFRAGRGEAELCDGLAGCNAFRDSHSRRSDRHPQPNRHGY